LESIASLKEEASLIEVRPRENKKCFCMLITVYEVMWNVWDMQVGTRID
jgi:hypothetical protein